MTQEHGGSAEPARSTKVSISENVLIQDLGEESVILNINNEGYYGLDNTGTQFWNWLKEDGDIDRVYERAVEKYSIDPEVLKKDIGVFVAELSNAGLLTFDEDAA